MWKRISAALLWFMVAVGVIVSIILALSIPSFELSLVIFVVGVLVTFIAASAFGLLVEMAFDIEKIAKNTEGLVSKPNTLKTAEVKTALAPVAAKQAEPKGWICEACSTANNDSSLFCKNCGEKKKD